MVLNSRVMLDQTVDQIIVRMVLRTRSYGQVMAQPHMIASWTGQVGEAARDARIR